MIREAAAAGENRRGRAAERGGVLDRGTRNADLGHGHVRAPVHETENGGSQFSVTVFFD